MSKQKIIFILIGAQASGKGTQGHLLSEKFSIPHISSGHLVRQKIKDNDELSKKLQKVVKAGLFINDDLMFDILKDRLSKDDCKKGYILDGYPRNIVQMKLLNNYLKNIDPKNIFVYYLDINPKIIWQRVQGRLLCSNCGKAYDINLFPPRKPGVCDVCGHELIKREDDKKAVIKERYKLFLEQTWPVVQYYKNEFVGNFAIIDGGQSIEEIFKNVIKYYYDQIEK